MQPSPNSFKYGCESLLPGRCRVGDTAALRGCPDSSATIKINGCGGCWFIPAVAPVGAGRHRHRRCCRCHRNHWWCLRRLWRCRLHSSMRILASRTLLMVPQVALVVPQVALGQVEIPVGIQMSLSQAMMIPCRAVVIFSKPSLIAWINLSLPSRSSPCMDFKASFDVVEAAKSLLTRAFDTGV